MGTKLPLSPLVKLLDMNEHREGGWYKEMWKASFEIPKDILPEQYSGPRFSATSIYFILHGDEISQQEVQEWLEQLPQRDRQALLMKYSGYSYAEIAEELQLKQPIVGTLLHRATNKLRKKMLRST